MTVNIITGASSAALQGATPDGSPSAAAAGQLVSAAWIPTANVGGGDFDTLFTMNPVDEPTVLAEGGTMTPNPATVFAQPYASRATLGAGPAIRRSAKTTVGGGILVYPLDGILPIDQWTISVWAKSIGVDAQTLTNGTVFGIITPSQQTLTLMASGGFLQATLNVNETQFQVAGSNNSLTAQLTLVTGDIPADTWTKLSVIFDGSNLYVMIGDNAKISAGAAYSGGWLRRPWCGEPLTASGIVIGNNAVFGAGTPKWEIAEFTVNRYPRTYNTSARGKPATITTDATTTQGAWPRYVGGIVDHYTGASYNETDTLTAVRDAQIAACGAAGTPICRFADFTQYAIPAAISGSTVTSIDFTKLDTYMTRWHNAGFDFCVDIAYTPALFGATRGTVPSNTAAYADYASKVITHMIAAGFRVKFCGFWNEPDQPNQWLGTVAQFAALWVAVAQRMQTDNPTVPFGGVDGLWLLNGGATSATAYSKAVMDAAQANSLPLPFLLVHDYNRTLTTLRQQIDDMRAYATSKGFTSIPVHVSEWNYVLGNADLRSAYLDSLEMRRLTAHGAGYAHAHTYECVASGGTYQAFYRLGITAAQAEDNLYLLTGDTLPQPTPTWGALSLIWKHAGNRVSSVTNWPNLRALASKATDGTIILTYSSYRIWRAKDTLTSRLEWNGLPSTFTWKHWKVDYDNGADGRPILVASGTQANLPLAITHSAVGMGCIQIKP